MLRLLVAEIRHTHLITMSGQRKISAFMKPLQQKRTNVQEVHTSPKKAKLSDDPRTLSPVKTPDQKKHRESPEQENQEGAASSPPTPEQVQRSQDHRVQAEMKLAARKTSGLVVNMGATWYSALEGQFSKPYFVKLSKFVEAERQKHKIFPPADQVWAWTQMCDIRDVKVVILGQDPYHGVGQAHGLCFSVQKGVTPPPSLVNMYKELVTDVPGFTRPDHGNLSGWARQGVLLLNAVLTVRAHAANSHKDRGWENLTDAVISWLNTHTDGLVFMLWGAYAQKKGACINTTRHRVLKSVHPSPLSAHRGFIGCRHFSQCNDYLESEGKTPIDWGQLPAQS